MTARNTNKFHTKKSVDGSDQSVAPVEHQYLFQFYLGSSMLELNAPSLGSRGRGPGRTGNAFWILHYILFPVKSFKIAARSFRVPWLVGSSHYSPITTLPYHYNTFLAGHLWPVPVSEIVLRSFY